MAEAKDDYLAKHKKMHDAAEVSFDTFKHHHHQAYAKSVDEHLTDGKGKVHYEWLDEGKKDGDKKISARDLRKSFKTEMRDFYVKKIESQLKIKVEDEATRNSIAKVWYGVDMSVLDNAINQQGSKFNWDFYKGRVVPSFERELEPQVYAPSTEHINEDHTKKIAKELGIEDRLTSQLSVVESRELLKGWRSAGENLSEELLRGIVGNKLIPKKKKKK
jgi:hypothetical protein